MSSIPLQDRLLDLSCEAAVSDLENNKGFSDHENKFNISGIFAIVRHNFGLKSWFLPVDALKDLLQCKMAL